MGGSGGSKRVVLGADGGIEVSPGSAITGSGSGGEEAAACGMDLGAMEDRYAASGVRDMRQFST
jgi:hypothetical protein